MGRLVNKRGMGEKVVVWRMESSVIVGADGGEEWGERIEEACEQEGDGGDGGDVEEGEWSASVGEEGGEECGERVEGSG